MVNPSPHPHAFTGVRVQTSVRLVEHVATRQRRSWRERLFTRPWTPAVAYRTVITTRPSREGYVTADGSLLMHPVTYARLRGSLPRLP